VRYRRLFQVIFFISMLRLFSIFIQDTNDTTPVLCAFLNMDSKWVEMQFAFCIKQELCPWLYLCHRWKYFRSRNQKLVESQSCFFFFVPLQWARWSMVWLWMLYVPNKQISHRMSLFTSHQLCSSFWFPWLSGKTCSVLC